MLGVGIIRVGEMIMIGGRDILLGIRGGEGDKGVRRGRCCTLHFV